MGAVHGGQEQLDDGPLLCLIVEHVLGAVGVTLGLEHEAGDRSSGESRAHGVTGVELQETERETGGEEGGRRRWEVVGGGR